MFSCGCQNSKIRYCVHNKDVSYDFLITKLLVNGMGLIFGLKVDGIYMFWNKSLHALSMKPS